MTNIKSILFNVLTKGEQMDSGFTTYFMMLLILLISPPIALLLFPLFILG
jgi:hypothetical protein